MIIEEFTIGSIVKVMDFVAIVTKIEISPYGEGIFITLESPKRIALHQTNLDRLDLSAAPWAWKPATALDLLQDAVKWFGTND